MEAGCLRGTTGTIRGIPTRQSSESLCTGSQDATDRRTLWADQLLAPVSAPMIRQGPVDGVFLRKQKPHRDALESQQGPDGCCSKL
jgi:hypothetical protein